MGIARRVGAENEKHAHTRSVATPTCESAKARFTVLSQQIRVQQALMAIMCLMGGRIGRNLCL